MNVLAHRKLTRWRCVECGNLLDHHRYDCPKCEGDVVSVVVEYVLADDYEGAVDLLRDVATSGVSFEDPRVRYLEVQIDRETWDALATYRGQ